MEVRDALQEILSELEYIVNSRDLVSSREINELKEQLELETRLRVQPDAREMEDMREEVRRLRRENAMAKARFENSQVNLAHALTDIKRLQNINQSLRDQMENITED